MSGMMTLRRMHQEILNVISNLPEHYSIRPDLEDRFLWRATLMGPPDSAYEGGKVEMTLRFTQRYPVRPLKILQIKIGLPLRRPADSETVRIVFFNNHSHGSEFCRLSNRLKRLWGKRPYFEGEACRLGPHLPFIISKGEWGSSPQAKCSSLSTIQSWTWIEHALPRRW
ncbi:hypothetical protein AVEN_83474-1 [Araneus ventricosus]|uniref:UBC core domain-containing protein n=1 Tax=Araneus ventricosus TaxID=182803 RepID=A0A4Y2WZB8_ARAVE|nr:hypothetical protein AVEN_83474-1 [Araneus ventricosus]